MWTRVNLKKETAPSHSLISRAYRKHCNEFSDAFLSGKYTLEELLNESMSEALLVFISENVPAGMRSALHKVENMHECVRLAMGLSYNPEKLISPETQDLALGLSLLMNTKSTMVQCNTTFQPGHSDRCTSFWGLFFNAIEDAVTIHTKYHLPADDPIRRMTAAFSTIIRHAIMNWNKGMCILFHLSEHPAHVQFLLDYIEYDDVRDAVVRLIYCDHSYEAMQKLKATKLISQLVQRLTSRPVTSEKDNVESVLRSLIYSPYISPRGDLIFVKSIPKDTLTGEPDYVQLCGSSRDLTNAPLRQFTSRKVRHLVHMVMEQTHVPAIVDGMLEEFRCYTPTTRGLFCLCRQNKIDRLVVSFGCTRHLTALFELVTTVEFSEKTGKGQVGIECQYMHCQTHVMIHELVTINGDDVKALLNCMLGLMVQPLSGAPMTVSIENIVSAKASAPTSIVVQCKDRDSITINVPSKESQARWLLHFENALKGNAVELDIFCSDDWKSNIAEYQALRLAVIQTLESRASVLTSIVHTPTMASWPAMHLCDMMQAIVGMQSKRMDALLLASGLLGWLLNCYAVVKTSWLLTRMSQIVVFYLSDPNCKRSRSCPVVAHLMQHGPAKFAAGPRGFVTCIYEVVDQCIHCPHSNSMLRVGQLASESAAWTDILSKQEPSAEPPHPSAIPSILQSASFPRPPAFQKDILDLLAQPSFASYDIGSSFLVGNGCVFGYVYKKENNYWKRALVVFEQTSYKLWSFIPSQHKPLTAINWQWIIPTSVVPHFCHGEDELHTSIGHHGFDVLSDVHHNNTTWNFCTTALHERDEWIQVLQTAAATIAALAQHTVSKDSKGSRECVNCHAAFHVFRRPHPCLRCGKTLCTKCAKIQNYHKPIPEMGILTPVRHCQSCFDASGGAMSEKFPTLLNPGGPLLHEGGGNDLDRVGPELDAINKTRKTILPLSSTAKRQMFQLDIPSDDESSPPSTGLSFPSTPLEVEDKPTSFAKHMPPLSLAGDPSPLEPVVEAVSPTPPPAPTALDSPVEAMSTARSNATSDTAPTTFKPTVVVSGESVMAQNGVTGTTSSSSDEMTTSPLNGELKTTRHTSNGHAAVDVSSKLVATAPVESKTSPAGTK
ncbi:Aste57867_2228 [Aphanomyces stellatus]|uniref:Aste57867_2228 protein n=1 Tax=Aphanomyces stellatus TaxID=120398 RepID=A0A485KBE9_9STRA|nr:hypothetical protein As57867_002223 [Aphanomyces stellatus]VFT79431.1 Aste57867_2228 [Aphanomyces stellatus]